MKKLSFFLMAMLMSVMSFAAEVSVTISTYADDHNWSNGVQYKTVEIDDVVSITATGTSNTGKYYTSGEQWRTYQTESPKITVTAKDGYLLKSATFTYASKNTGILQDAAKNQVNSGSVYTFNSDVASYTFGVGNTGKATNGQVNFTKITVVYELSSSIDPGATTYTVTALVNDQTMGTVTGAGEYIEGTTATLTANPNSGYEFVKWSNESTDNPLKITVTEDATYTAIFQEQTPITCSQINDLAIGDAFVLGEFTVTYVNGSYTYIKDATGASLIYASNYGLKAGDVVTGLAGTRANFNGLVQINPTVTKAQLTITAGTAPQPEVATANPTQADMNKYVKYEQVTFDATAFSSKKINATLAGQTTKFAVYDQWSFNKTFVKGGTYEFIGAVSYYNAVQVNFISATKVSITISATATGGKVTGTGEYMEGEEATLIATANEGYEFVNWTWADEVVCTTPEYTFEVEEAMSLVANFAKKTYTVTVTAENGTVEGADKYEHGTVVTLTANPESGYKFVNWTSGETEVSTANPFTFTVTSDTTLVANFAVVEPEVITYELNGGELVVEVPTQEELWASFKTAAGLTTLGTLAEITEAGAGKPHNDPDNPCACRIICAKLLDANVNAVFALPEWAWLKAYIMTVQSGLPEASSSPWRYAIAAFFLQSQHSAYPASADFTEAGKPENWGAAYEAAHEVVLPTEPVAEDYTLPTPVKEGYTFVGWYDNAEGAGDAYTVIPAGWAGTLYAIWKQGPTTALENIAVEGKAVKAIINGQLIIIKNGVQYNALGQVIR